MNIKKNIFFLLFYRDIQIEQFEFTGAKLYMPNWWWIILFNPAYSFDWNQVHIQFTLSKIDHTSLVGDGLQRNKVRIVLRV